MKKAMTMSITLIAAMVVALVVILILIVMFTGAMDKGNKGVSDTINPIVDDKLPCASHCSTCCLEHSRTYCESTAPAGCECPGCQP